MVRGLSGLPDIRVTRAGGVALCLAMLTQCSVTDKIFGRAVDGPSRADLTIYQPKTYLTIKMAA